MMALINYIDVPKLSYVNSIRLVIFSSVAFYLCSVCIDDEIDLSMSINLKLTFS